MNNKTSGKVHNEEFFRYVSSELIQFSEILKVLKGELLGCIFFNSIPEAFSDTVYANAFDNNASLKDNRDKEALDEAPPISIGTQHYKKELSEYLDESERVAPELENLFKNVSEEDNFFKNFINDFSAFLDKRGIQLRLAEHQGRLASPFWIRSFDGSQEFIINPHDDVPQLRSPKQAGFEIQSVSTIIAVNMCLENENGGVLFHYNLEPDDEMRRAYGVEHTGFPYPLHALKEIQKTELEAKKGDFYFFNANNIHAVKVGNTSKKLRTTMSWFMGLKDDSTVLYWI
jgi:hypothetical protein